MTKVGGAPLTVSINTNPANNLTYLLLLRSELELECGGESGSNLVTHIVRADDLKVPGVWRIGLGNFHQRQPGDLETNRNASKIKHNPFGSFHSKLPPKTDIRTNFNIHKKKMPSDHNSISYISHKNS